MSSLWLISVTADLILDISYTKLAFALMHTLVITRFGYSDLNLINRLIHGPNRWEGDRPNISTDVTTNYYTLRKKFFLRFDSPVVEILVIVVLPFSSEHIVK